MTFKIQIPTDIIRNDEINAMEFVLLAKLIQAYYLSSKQEEFELHHKNLIFLLNIGDNNTFKKSYNKLVKQGYIVTPIDKLPRKGGINVKLNMNIIPELNKKLPFAQLNSSVLDKSVIDAIGYIGIRLIYYYQSYINRKDIAKNHCYASEETIAAHLGITKRTVIEYNKKLKKNKMVKITGHELMETGEYKRKKDKEVIVFNKYNNHYFVKEDRIIDFASKKQGLLTV
ncbi:hypothetical protein [Cytobacillus praedii]|uniref:Helix-turn-helix domain-containing protein n=1 Tax=Cytobacillus praedii TaxID=1742358 RepID=A0A4R1AMJ8_9BACI|nr:hypothetical protein [Cytobacillus praedii]TCJ00967.1 hypothetical protein E0Y62_26315 [Cytobacillus praedii]